MLKNGVGHCPISQSLVRRTVNKNIVGGVTKTLPKIASKFLFTSLRCKLNNLLLFLIALRNSKKSKSIV